MTDSIDSIVKGAPQAGPTLQSSPDVTTNPLAAEKPSDPLKHTPSSPSMIYLNMLILEASLRAQYLELRTRRRKHTFFLSLLCLWLAGFGYALFFAPREDGSGVGGSVYWMVDMAEKVCFISGIFTGLLIWATGIWERGIRWPRRWLGISNRGLRGFNCKLVLMKRSWPVEVMSTLGFFFTYGAFSSKSGQYRFVDPSLLHDVDRELNINRKEHHPLPFAHHGDEEKGNHEEDLAPGGDYVKLLLLPKPFTPTFRENWEIYRSEYWERENDRRALLRAKLKAQEKQLAKEQNGWLWWLPGRPVHMEPKPERHTTPESSGKVHHHRPSVARGDGKRSRSGSVRRGSASAGSSRSPTPPVESEEPAPISSRRSSTSSVGKKKRHLSSGSRSKRPGLEMRSLTPEFSSPLAQESKVGSEA